MRFFVCLLGCVYLYLSGEYFTVTTSLLVKGTSINRFLLFFFVQAVTLPSNVCDDWLIFGNQEMYNLRKYVLYETCVQNFVYFSSKNLE